ncbi:MAG TPA: ABC transporter permease [Steroidobacteraceae bacterium]|nr:ABC transporter permease [Steroidobacteraceae bacterium]
MFGYYLQLALRSLRRNPALTVLMIVAIGVGIGAAMTTLTVFRAMAADPIAARATQLFAPQIDAWGLGPNGPNPDHLSGLLDYIDATALMRAHAGERQTVLYKTQFAVHSPQSQLLPLRAGARAAYADFFRIFDVPFRYGGPWSAAEDQGHVAVVVISRELNDRLFGGANSVGRALQLDEHEFRVVGVLANWDPVPRYYDLSDAFGSTPEAVFLPFTTAIDLHKHSSEGSSCVAPTPPGWDGLLRSDCTWLQFWVELPTRTDVARYRAYLTNYASEQQRSGRFHWPPHVQLRNVRQWLVYQHVVSNESRILVLVSFSFLLVCLLNAMGLMLARIMRRVGEISVRRALGAARAVVFAQCLIEATLIGVAGALLGLALTVLGLTALRALLGSDMQVLSHMDAADMLLTVAVAIVATILAGLYPTWRATRVQPAWQLKAQ